MGAPKGNGGKVKSRHIRTRIELNKQRAQELNELLERSRADIAAAETKRTRQTAAMQEANALIEKTEKLLQAKEAELKKADR